MTIKFEEVEVYRQAIESWGKGSQIEMLIEEMAELTLALQKFKRSPSKHTAEAVCDEMADVDIMIRQNTLVFPIAKIRERRKFKFDRLKGSLEKDMFKKYAMDEEELEKEISKIS